MALYKSFCAITAVVLCLWTNTVSSLQLTIEPHSYDTLNSQGGVTFACTLDTREDLLDQLFSLKIQKQGGIRLALLHLNAKPEITDQRKVTGSGSLTQKGGVDPYLNVTLQAPTSDDAGIYECVVVFVNNAAAFETHTATDFLTIKKPTLDNLQSKVSNLLTEMAGLKQEFSKCGCGNKATTVHPVILPQPIVTPSPGQLKAAVQEILKHESSVLGSLVKDVAELKEQVAALSHNQTMFYDQFFSASKPFMTFLENGKDVIYDKFNVPSSTFDVQTGVFTASAPGRYLFILMAEGSPKFCEVEWQLEVNDKMVDSVSMEPNEYVKTHLNHGHDLNPGDKVKVVSKVTPKPAITSNSTDTAVSFSRTPPGSYTFMGYRVLSSAR